MNVLEKKNEESHFSSVADMERSRPPTPQFPFKERPVAPLGCEQQKDLDVRPWSVCLSS